MMLEQKNLKCCLKRKFVFRVVCCSTLAFKNVYCYNKTTALCNEFCVFLSFCCCCCVVCLCDMVMLIWYGCHKAEISAKYQPINFWLLCLMPAFIYSNNGKYIHYFFTILIFAFTVFFQITANFVVVVVISKSLNISDDAI